MNKPFITFLLLIMACRGYSQNIPTIPWPSKHKTFVDTFSLSGYYVFIDIEKVKDATVGKGFDSVHGPAIYIRTKCPGDYYFLSLADIKKRYNVPEKGPTIFKIDNRYLKDELGQYLIDSSYILNVDVTSLKEFKSLKKKFSPLVIIHIETRSKQKTDANKIKEIE